MRIRRVSIKNYRSVQELHFEPSQLTALVGPNNSGKSNILSAFHRVLGTDWLNVRSFSEDDVYGRDPERDILIRVEVDPPIEYKEFKYQDAATIAALEFEYTRYRIGEAIGERRLSQKCFDEEGKAPMLLAKAPKKGEQRQYKPVATVPNDIRGAIPLIYIGTNRSLSDQMPTARRSLLRQLLEDVNNRFRDPTRRVTVKTAAGEEIDVSALERFGQLTSEMMALLRTDDLAGLERSIKTRALQQLGLDPVADAEKLDFFFAPFDTMDFYRTLDLKVREAGTELSATSLGEGFQNAIVLAILQAFEERRKQGAIILIEEPEMFLHPQMQRSLYRSFRAIAETNQIIYATHSPHFVTVPDYREVVLVRKGDDGTRVTESTLPYDVTRREKLLKELDPERNEMFFARRLLLVEGDTEKLALPEFARRMGLDLDRAGATIVEVGGKRNLPEFLEIASSFGIPTGIVYDEDSSDFGDNRPEEAAFNAQLDAYRKADGTVRVWRLSKKYEDHVKKAVGDAEYQRLCQKFPRVGKPTRQRLIAMEEAVPIPAPLEEVLRWLCGTG